MSGREALPSRPTARASSSAPNGASIAFAANGQKFWRTAVPGTTWGVNLSADGRFIVAAFGDGTIRWFRASDGAELLAFFVHVPDKTWIAWTPTAITRPRPAAKT